MVLAAFAACVAVARHRRRVLLVSGLGIVLGYGHAALAVHAFEGQRALVAEALPGVRTCTGRVRVESSPTVAGGVARFVVFASALECDGTRAPPLRAAVYGGPEDAARGDELEVVAHLSPPDRFANPELGDPQVDEARRGVVRTGGLVTFVVVSSGSGPAAWIDRARAHVRARVQAQFPSETAPMARALLLGENDLAKGDDVAFRQSGLAHLLAVSGMHLVLVVVGAVRLISGLLSRFQAIAARWDVARIASLAGLPVTWAYCDFAGGSGSARRAAWMLSALLLARVLGRRPMAARAFALSLVGASLADPLAAFDVSFTLSALATGGLLVFGQPWSRALERFAPAWLARSLGATSAASFACAPLIARISAALPIGGIPANLLAVPVGELAALPVCLLFAVLSFVPSAEQGAATVASGALHLVRSLADHVASVPALQAPVPRPTAAQLGLMAFSVFAWLAGNRRARKPAVLCAAAGLVLAEIGAMPLARAHPELRVTYIDVGQGDAALVDLPDGTAALIDGGGLVGSPVDIGARVVAPLLRARRRSSLALVVLTHPHPDHAGGLATGLTGARVAEAWDTGQGEREGAGGSYAAFLASMRRAGTPIRHPSEVCGSRAIGGAAVEVLAPCPGPEPGRSPNDNSFVLRVAYGERSFLFTGDAEADEESSLLRERASALGSDVLKVGHHGSRTSSSGPFLDAVHPRVAVISCGVRNRFGHPAPSTLASLTSRGVLVLRTDRNGQVSVATDGHALFASAVDGLPKAFYSALP